MNKNFFYGLFAFIFLLLLNPTCFATKIDKIVAFGDSMTDNGNIYKLTMEAHKLFPLVPIIPKNPPYYDGRFSNGPIWVDLLAEDYNVPLEDYAYGGSWAEPILDSKINVPFGLEMQVTYYLFKSALDFHKDRHLYLIWTGANDYIQDRDDAEYATSKTVATIKKEIEWLIYYGAKHIFVLNIPNLGVVPQVAAKGREFAMRITELTQLHNTKLAKMLSDLALENPDVNLIAGDTSKYLDDIIINPTKYSLRNVSDACYGGGYWINDNLADQNEIHAALQSKLDILGSPSLREAYLNSKMPIGKVRYCERPDDYLFWDHLHPTQIAHRIIDKLALKKLTENGIEV